MVEKNKYTTGYWYEVTMYAFILAKDKDEAKRKAKRTFPENADWYPFDIYVNPRPVEPTFLLVGKCDIPCEEEING